jgi:branched-chain amino acid transport system substrate-binding protein
MRSVGRRTVLAGGLCLPGVGALGVPSVVPAKTNGLTIGVLSDFSGPYADIAGAGSLACVRQAVREAVQAGLPAAEVISADHHNEPSIGAGIARNWYGRGVDLIIDVPNSAVALAVNAVAREANRAYINCGAGADALTGSDCAPTTLHWSYTTHMLARSTGGALVAAGGSTWFFITPDYAFGHEMQAETTAQVLKAGGRILGDASYRFPGTVDFSGLLRQAAQSSAQVLGLANAGADVIACVAQARAQGIADETRIACLLMQIADVHRLGLEKAAGLMLTESFYWDLNERTRAFTKRLMEAEKPPNYPDMIQAGCYAGTLHFLKAVSALGVANARSDGALVVAKMKAMPTDDDAFGACSIRKDGMVMLSAMLFQVKAPEESDGPWDYYRHVSTVGPEEAFVPMVRDGCGMVKR